MLDLLLPKRHKTQSGKLTFGLTARKRPCHVLGGLYICSFFTVTEEQRGWNHQYYSCYLNY